MCNVPVIAVFCRESTECFPGTVSKIFPQASHYYSSGSNYYWYNRTFQVPHSLHFYTQTLVFQLLFRFLIIIIIIIIIIIKGKAKDRGKGEGKAKAKAKFKAKAKAKGKGKGKGEGKGKSKVHPRTGHEGPEGE